MSFYNKYRDNTFYLITPDTPSKFKVVYSSNLYNVSFIHHILFERSIRIMRAYK